MRNCIQPGETIPDIPFDYRSSRGILPATTHEFFAGKKAILLTVPAAFTVTYTKYYLPAFKAHYQ